MAQLISPKTLAKEMGTERRTRLAGLMDEGITGNEILARIRGPPFAGRDDAGQPVPTRPPECLKMHVSGMHVSIKYRREESGKIDESFAQGVEMPKKQITANTDVFKGVRSLKHVRESYEKEFAKRDALLGDVERINSELALEGGNMDGARIAAMENRIESIEEGISHDRAAAKKLGRIKIEEIYEYLESARYLQGFQKQKMVSAACSKLVAFRNRYGQWRDGEAARIMAYNRLRECALRTIRDNALVRLCNEWAGFIEKYGYAAPRMWKRDLENSRRLDGLAKSVASGDAGALAQLIEIGKALKDNAVEGKAKKELREAYHELKEGDVKAGLAKIFLATDALEANKPWHVLEQLGKTDDSYLEPTIGRIRKAKELLLENNHVVRSAQLLREAAQKMQ